MNKGKFYLKVLTVIFLSYLVSSFVGSTVFIRNSPQIRSNPISYIVNRVRNKYNSFIAKVFPDKTKSNKVSLTAIDDMQAKSAADQVAADLMSTPLKTVAKGIYAKDNGQKSMTVINTGEVEKVQLTYQLNGETVTITIPKAYYDSLGLSDDEIINMSKKAKQ